MPLVYLRESLAQFKPKTGVLVCVYSVTALIIRHQGQNLFLSSIIVLYVNLVRYTCGLTFQTYPSLRYLHSAGKQLL